VNDLSHIIHYSLPDESEIYTHRSGRTGRAGKTGISISIINLKEKHKVREIEKKINKTFTAAAMPSGKDICAKQVFNLMDRIEKVKVSEKEIADLLPQVYRKLEWLEKEDLIKRIVSLEFNRLIDYYQEAEDIQTIDEKAAGRRERENKPQASRDTSGAEPGFARIFIGLGRMDGISPKNILGLLNDYVDRKIQVGRIDFFTRYSLFDVEEKSAKKVVHALRGLDFLGRNVRVDLATPEQMSRAWKERKAFRSRNVGSRKK
nr:DEAD/DEAH box helicase [Bacteroidales bacterium]